MSMIIGNKPNINTPLGWVLVVFAIILIAFSIGLMLGGIFVQNKLNQRFNNDLNKMMNDRPKQTQITLPYTPPLKGGGYFFVHAPKEGGECFVALSSMERISFFIPSPLEGEGKGEGEV